MIDQPSTAFGNRMLVAVLAILLAGGGALLCKHADAASPSRLVGAAAMNPPTPESNFRLTDQSGQAVSPASLRGKWQLDREDLSPEKSFGFGSLKFTMTDAETGKTVTQTDFRGKIVMLYFGYTNCPDVCPLTLSNAARIFHQIGANAKDIRFLFVTVDPRRDTVPVLRSYVGLFGTGDIVGLRGTEAELKAAAAQFGARYSVHPSSDPAEYAVTHTALVYVFNRQGKPEFTIVGLSNPHPDIKGIARDLAHLVSTNVS